MSNSELSFSGEIITIVQHELKQLPAPLTGNIRKVYDDDHVDVRCDDGVLMYVPVIGTPVVDKFCLIIYCNQSFNVPVCVC